MKRSELNKPTPEEMLRWIKEAQRVAELQSVSSQPVVNEARIAVASHGNGLFPIVTPFMDNDEAFDKTTDTCLITVSSDVVAKLSIRYEQKLGRFAPISTERELEGEAF